MDSVARPELVKSLRYSCRTAIHRDTRAGFQIRRFDILTECHENTSPPLIWPLTNIGGVFTHCKRWMSASRARKGFLPSSAGSPRQSSEIFH